MKVFRKNFLLGFGLGAEGLVDAAGTVELEGGGGGVRGTFSAGIVEELVGVVGVGFELADVATLPGGAGSDVAGLAEPGRTTGFESDMDGLSAYPLCNNDNQHCSHANSQ